MPTEHVTPGLEDLPSSKDFAELVAHLGAVEPRELRLLWKRAPSPRQIPDLGRLLTLSRELSADIESRAPWERVLLAAGHEGGAAARSWLELRAMVESGVAEWQKSRALLLAHTVVIDANTDLLELRRVLPRIETYRAQGGVLGALTILWRRDWNGLLGAIRVDGSVPSVPIHFRAIEAHITLIESRRRLRERWARQAEPVGLPAYGDLSDPPEQLLGRYADSFSELISSWNRWSGPLHELIESTGFDWEAHRARELGRSAPSDPFDLDVHLLGEPLEAAVAARLAAAREVEAQERLERLARQLDHDAGTGSRLRAAVRNRDTAECQAVYESLRMRHRS